MADLLVERGYAARQGGGNGWAYFRDGSQSVPVSKTAQTPQLLRRDDPAIIDVDDFKEIPPEAPCTGRALVPVSQPADSRTEAALRQHAAAKARAGRASQGHVLAGQIPATWNSLYAFDPVEIERAQIAAERRQLELEQQEAASKAIAVAPPPPEPGIADYIALGCMAAARGLDVWQI